MFIADVWPFRRPWPLALEQVGTERPGRCIQLTLILRPAEQSLDRCHESRAQSVRICTLIHSRSLTLHRTSSTIKGPTSSMSPAQRVRVVAAVTVGATTLTAVIGVWMRYQGYTFRGLWSWFGRTSGMFSSKV